MPILFVLELSTHGRTWVRGIDIWKSISNQPDFQINTLLKFGKDLGCFDVEQRQGSNGSMDLTRFHGRYELLY
jgi:hypothetical protein